MTAPDGPVAVTGCGGRLGSALVRELRRRGGRGVLGWDVPDHDLDDAGSAWRLVERDRPALVIHTAAWTDVDGCARDPALAHRRNAEATAELAAACIEAGASLLVVSTNEVFDGTRADGRGYTEDEPTNPLNPYAVSKLGGEAAARSAFADRPGLWVARTAWLYGPPGNDFPAKIVAAADRLPPDEPLPVVADEFGSPTYTLDLAEAIVSLVERTDGGVFHLVNAGHASRYEWAAEVLRRLRPDRELRPISRTDFVRPSTPPAWGVLDGSKAAAAGVVLREWRAAVEWWVESSGTPDRTEQRPA